MRNVDRDKALERRETERKREEAQTVLDFASCSEIRSCHAVFAWGTHSLHVLAVFVASLEMKK